LNFRILAQFAFRLSAHYELNEKATAHGPGGKDSLNDMLIKHHLFSWNIWTDNSIYDTLAANSSTWCEI